MAWPAIALTLFLYLVAAGLALRRAEFGVAERASAFAAIVLHAFFLGHQVLHGASIALGVNEALSLFAWQSAALLWAFCWREPLRTLGVGIYPLAALALTLATAFPSSTASTPITDWKERLHIVLALLSAGLLTLAAVQAVVLATQDRLLHNREPGRLLRALPPLLTMERLLFQLIFIGFVLLSATLLSGLWFLQDWLKQHLAHKTVLSITAWLIFGVLLWGRWRHGWRGKVAIRWALAGYATLILAYFGSKLILEQILGRHWS